MPEGGRGMTYEYQVFTIKFEEIAVKLNTMARVRWEPLNVWHKGFLEQDEIVGVLVRRSHQPS